MDEMKLVFDLRKKKKQFHVKISVAAKKAHMVSGPNDRLTITAMLHITEAKIPRTYLFMAITCLC